MLEPRRPRKELQIIQAEKYAKSPGVEGEGQRNEERQKEEIGKAAPRLEPWRKHGY